jgi:hypothetical protein
MAETFKRGPVLDSESSKRFYKTRTLRLCVSIIKIPITIGGDGDAIAKIPKKTAIVSPEDCVYGKSDPTRKVNIDECHWNEDRVHGI